MKIIPALLVSLICIQLFACSKNNEVEPTDNADNISSTATTKMKITIGTAVFTATLYENTTTKELIAQLPFTLDMTELNGNEKYYDLPNALPTNAKAGGDIKAGDLMLYGNNVLVLFYKDFNTSYNYTKLGYIDNPMGLAAALGSENVTVKFEKQ
jgi:hypothetical protein